MARLPRSIGPYRILEKLGQGGMGVVYRAEHWKSGQPVAVKTVRVPRRSGLAAIRREIYALARLRHPGIVPILEEGLQRGVPWYAMELLHGSTLHQFLEQRAASLRKPDTTVPPSRRWWTRTLDRLETTGAAKEALGKDSAAEPHLAAAGARQPAPGGEPTGPSLVVLPAGELLSGLNLVRRLCAPLGFLHGEGLVHRDLKPENIWLRPDGQPVLVDFGIVSRFADELSREQLEPSGTTGGTLAYMAPEQIRDELVDARADLYSLGCLLYELVTGRPPFVGSSPMQVLRQHLSDEPLPPSRLASGVPKELEALVLRLLEKQPQRRLGHADDVAASLARVLDALGAEVADVGEAPRGRPYLYRPCFVGREKLLRELLQQLGRAEEGSSGVALLSGESGSGKTRLLMELVGEAHRRGLHVLAGEALSPVGAAEPLGPLRQPLQALGDLCRERGRAETDRLLGARGKLLALYEPALAALSGQEAYAEDRAAQSDASLPPDAARLRVFQALAESFGALSMVGVEGSAAVLLVLDDLQWADELTLGFMRFLAQAAGAARRLLAVGAYRSEEAGAEQAAALRALLECKEAQRLPLERLEESSVGSMVADMLAMPAPPELFVRFLSRQSEGNAFFVAEYLRTAIAREVLYRDEEGYWQVAAPTSEEATEEVFEALPLPGSVRSLVGRRLEGLGAGARQAVGAAAVLGREVDEELLGRVVRLGGARRLDAIQELLAREVLEQAGSGRLRFVHDKIREVAYGKLSASRRVRLHRKAAEALSALSGPEREQRLGELGQHWERAGLPDEARPVYLQAARVAASRHALGEAERLLRAFLSLSPQPTTETVEARQQLGGLLRLQGHASKGIAELHVALAEARTLGDRLCEAQTLQKLGIVCHEAGQADEARGAYEHALDIAGQLGDRKLEALCLSSLAVLHKQQERVAEARGLYHRALLLLREIGDRAQEAVTLSNFALLQAEQGAMQEARKLYEEALPLAREFGQHACESNILLNLGVLDMDQGRFEQAEALLEQALAVVRRIGHRASEGLVLFNLAVAIFNQGRIQECQSLYEQSLAIVQSVGHRRNETTVLTTYAALRRDQGSSHEARALFEQALAGAREARSGAREGVVLREMAALERVSAGDLVQAQALASQAASLLEQVLSPIPLGLCYCEHGHIELAQGRSGRSDLQRAEQLAEAAQIQPGSELGKAIARLRHAAEAFEAGQPLFRGELFEDIPEGLRRWLAATACVSAKTD